ncbi:hypothetical protein [Pandoraea sp. PE-S2T-3]|uniref:hypothetical protein n=1 Tax=Pandoraea sp. PE-S2T-3 TaxID=1986993 RepID=UPI0015950D83|nr:hypothetical protein [Pandoraea sp. PE-S2T-3]
MLEFLVRLFSMVKRLWNNLPESAQEAIIKAVVDSFEATFRAFFQANKVEKSNA